MASCVLPSLHSRTARRIWLLMYQTSRASCSCSGVDDGPVVVVASPAQRSTSNRAPVRSTLRRRRHPPLPDHKARQATLSPLKFGASGPPPGASHSTKVRDERAAPRRARHCAGGSERFARLPLGCNDECSNLPKKADAWSASHLRRNGEVDRLAPQASHEGTAHSSPDRRLSLQQW